MHAEGRLGGCQFADLPRILPVLQWLAECVAQDQKARINDGASRVWGGGEGGACASVRVRVCARVYVPGEGRTVLGVLPYALSGRSTIDCLRSKAPVPCLDSVRAPSATSRMGDVVHPPLHPPTHMHGWRLPYSYWQLQLPWQLEP